MFRLCSNFCAENEWGSAYINTETKGEGGSECKERKEGGRWEGGSEGKRERKRGKEGVKEKEREGGSEGERERKKGKEGMKEKEKEREGRRE